MEKRPLLLCRVNPTEMQVPMGVQIGREQGRMDGWAELCEEVRAGAHSLRRGKAKASPRGGLIVPQMGTWREKGLAGRSRGWFRIWGCEEPRGEAVGPAGLGHGGLGRRADKGCRSGGCHPHKYSKVQTTRKPGTLPVASPSARDPHPTGFTVCWAWSQALGAFGPCSSLPSFVASL